MHLRSNRSGNVLIFILMTVLLLGLLTAAVTKMSGGSGNMDAEQAQIRTAKVVGFAVDLKRAVENMTRAGKSETTISFASQNLTGYGTPDTAAANEVFNIAGGGVGYVEVPENISNGSQWEFYGFTAAPNVGDDATPDLMMVLPNVTQAFCTSFNTKAGFPSGASIPTDSAACVHDTSKRFSGTFATAGAINTMDTATFPDVNKPYPSACVACGGSYHAYYVLLER
ncbi:MAG TPA: hypothetical protein VIN59_01350 [Alphaproteobacteria bacterium]